MRMSFVALNRIVEDRMKSDPEYPRDRPVLSTARAMSDAQLLEALFPAFGKLDRETFWGLCASCVSAEEMVRATVEDQVYPGRFDADWPWLAATVLWERWAPDVPSLEMLDDAMQEGYDVADSVKKCEIWLDVWSKLLVIADRRGCSTLSELDDLFGGTQALFNWVQDVELELYNAGRGAKEFLSERIRFCEGYLSRFGENHPEIDQGMRQAIADSHNLAGDIETVDRLYREWLTADPRWGGGWIGWSDCHWLFTPRERDFLRGEEILREGLTVADLRDREKVLDRLASLYSEAGRPEDEQKVKEESEALRGTPAVIPQRRKEKTGRNDPCPCGSGKKYKKCCGRR